MTRPTTYYCERCGFYHFTGKECDNKIEIKNFEPESQLDVQVDGDHYKKLKIQPAVYSHANELSWHQGEIIKYITRYKDKNGRKDLEKAAHLIEMLIELEY